MTEMTRDAMIALVERIHDEHDEMGRLMADSGNSPLRAIHTRMGGKLLAVITALTAEAASPEMPVLTAGDVLDLKDIGMVRVPYAAGAQTLQGSANVIAVYRAIWRRETPRG